MAPPGVTRHALAQLERLARRPGISFSVVTGRMTHPDGRAYWETLGEQARRELPVRTRDILPLVAGQALAADRLVDRPGRLGLLPGRVLRGDSPRQARRHQSRRLADPADSSPPESAIFSAGSSPGPTSSCPSRIQHPAIARRPSRSPKTAWLTCPTAPTISSLSRRQTMSEVASAPTWGFRPACPVSALGRQFSTAQEPAAADSTPPHGFPRSSRASLASC